MLPPAFGSGKTFRNQTITDPMPSALRMRQYQQQAVRSASPEQLVAKLFDLGVAACHRDDRAKLRAVLVELIGGLDFARGGEMATRLHALYDFCLRQSINGDLSSVGELLGGLRDAWKQGVLCAKAA